MSGDVDADLLAIYRRCSADMAAVFELTARFRTPDAIGRVSDTEVYEYVSTEPRSPFPLATDVPT